jgi:hypothetical protein
MSRWKQGDTAPAMVIDCFDGDGRPAPLPEAALVKIKVTQRGVLKWERNIPSGNRTTGTVTIPLQASDTDTPGTYYAKVYAEWPDGTKQHYPPGDQFVAFTVTR